MALTIARLEALRIRAYREDGYLVLDDDPAKGVLVPNAAWKTIRLMNRFTELVGQAIVDDDAKQNACSSLSEEQLEQAFLNIGYDIACGDCACAFFTGARGYGCSPGCRTTPRPGELEVHAVSNAGTTKAEGGA